MKTFGRYLYTATLFFLISRTSTDHRFRKELSDQDECMGWIVEHIKRYRPNQKSSKLDMNSWSYSRFSLHFRFFANFKDFNRPTLQEGGVVSKRMYGKNCSAYQALSSNPKIIQIGPELMELLTFFICIFAFFLIARVSTDQRLRKESSEQDHYMGWIVDTSNAIFQVKIIQIEHELKKLLTFFVVFSIFCWF